MATAAAVYCYFNSKYRAWKKELDQLAKTMQLLPGVPTQFSFSDIRRATNNFHETTKLGRGGFGVVYRLLPGPRKGETLEVAVKKFSRDDNRRYEDFLAEVSVINRLRHKNIVPFIGNDPRVCRCIPGIPPGSATGALIHTIPRVIYQVAVIFLENIVGGFLVTVLFFSSLIK
jgi:interleukin-1 receptor-associated kinase 1